MWFSVIKVIVKCLKWAPFADIFGTTFSPNQKSAPQNFWVKGIKNGDSFNIRFDQNLLSELCSHNCVVRLFLYPSYRLCCKDGNTSGLPRLFGHYLRGFNGILVKWFTNQLLDLHLHGIRLRSYSWIFHSTARVHKENEGRNGNWNEVVGLQGQGKRTDNQLDAESW